MRTLLHGSHEGHDEYDSDGFRLRGLGFSRLDGFSDVVFGFALTLIVVSLEVPKNFEELHHLWGAFLPFGVTFLLLILIWFEHFVYFRRFGTHDAGTIWLNGLLLFVVLFYVYPLKFLFLSVFGRAAALTEWREWTELVVVFSCGQAALYFLIAALYANAYRQRVKLTLTPEEEFLTRNSILEQSLTGAIGLLVCGLALVMPQGYASAACLAFMLIGALRSVLGFRARRGVERIRAAFATPQPDGTSEMKSNTASMMGE